MATVTERQWCTSEITYGNEGNSIAMKLCQNGIDLKHGRKAISVCVCDGYK